MAERLTDRPNVHPKIMAALLRKKPDENALDMGLKALYQSYEAIPPIPVGIGALRLIPALLMKGNKILPGKFGGMHFQILDKLKKHGLKEDDIIDSGFLTETGHYLTRKEAMLEARKVKPDFDSLIQDALHSEDLIKFHNLELPYFR